MELTKRVARDTSLFSVISKWGYDFMYEIGEYITDNWSDDQIIKIGSIQAHNDQADLSIMGTIKKNNKTWVSGIKVDMLNRKVKANFEWYEPKTDIPQTKMEFDLNQFITIRNLTTRIIEWLDSEVCKK